MKSMILVCSLVVTGCAGSAASIAMMSETELQAQDAQTLCNAYAQGYGVEKAKAELERRNAVPEDEWVLIDAKKIRIGMSELGLVCSWGYAFGGVHTSTGSWGVQKQWVYRGYRSTKYVYTKNGKVTSFSD